MQKRFPGFIVLLLLSSLLSSGDIQKSKKVYELIYQDIQVIKQQLLKLEEQISQNQEDIQRLSQQVAELTGMTDLARKEQINFLANQKNVPAQYQSILQRFDAIRSELSRISEQLIEIQRASVLPPEEEAETTEAQPPPDETEDAAQLTEVAQETTKTTLPPNLSPQEIYNMARSDYLKGNFELAIEGFSIYAEHFPESPLVDNARYWIGECYFSQKKFEEAVSQFNELILIYPQSDKIAAGYLKKGISLAEIGKKDEALATFRILISKYPLEEETKIAQQKIKELGLRE